MKELLNYQLDILCLQEVEAEQYTNYFEPELNKAGYIGIYVPKSRAKTMGEDRRFADGCATFFKRSKFILVEKHIVEYDKIAMNRTDFQKHKDSFNRIITKDNVAIMIVLKHQNHPQQKPLIVVNTHIHWDPTFADVKLIQTQILLESLQKLQLRLYEQHQLKQVAIVVCGDFNSMPDSSVYQLLTEGHVPSEHHDLGPYKYGVYTDTGFSHSLRLNDAYESVQTNYFTNYTDTFVGILDYILFSNATLDVSKVLEPVEEETIKYQVAMPNASYPSDHVPLVAEIIYKSEKPVPGSHRASSGSPLIPVPPMAGVKKGNISSQSSHHHSAASSAGSHAQAAPTVTSFRNTNGHHNSNWDRSFNAT